MRRLLLPMLFVIALVAVACSSSSAPGWTYAAPTAAASAGASAGASGAPSAGASGAPSAATSAAPSAAASAAPSGAESAAPSGGGAGAVVQISAMNIAFEQTDVVAAPAGTAFTIHFNNKEAVPHNIDIKDGSGTSVFKGDIVTGPKEVDYQVPALPAGDYTFACDVHPNMTGKIKAGG